MGFCFHLHTPDLYERDSGKFVACEKLLLCNNTPFIIPSISGYETGYNGCKYTDMYNTVYILDEVLCKNADEFTDSTLFTDFITEYDCNGMLITIS